MTAAPSAQSKRNVYTALGITCLAATFMFFVNQDGMQWMMWRDAPLLALGLVALAVFFFVLRNRAGR